MATVWINPGYGQKGFSDKELKDITISVIVLSLAFTIIYSRRGADFFSDNLAVNALLWFAVSVLIVTVCFLLHEFGHKFAAQKYGAWAEYRMFPQGLGLCLLLSLFGFLFAAPGAVMISGYIDNKRNGIISIAGPAVNLTLGALFIGLLFVTTGQLHTIIYLLAHFNVFLAVFNLIPIPPLDGSKVLKWNVPVYIVTAVIAVALLALFYI